MSAESARERRLRPRRYDGVSNVSAVEDSYKGMALFEVYAVRLVAEATTLLRTDPSMMPQSPLIMPTTMSSVEP